MSGYILKVSGVVLISIIVDIILPNGKMEKYVKSCMALIILFVIVSPLPSFVKNLQSYKLDAGDNLIDYDFVKKTNIKKQDEIEKSIISDLDDKGIKNIKIEIITDTSTTNLVFLFVNVDASNASLADSGKDLDIKEAITETILKYVSIKKENILFYGTN